MEVQPSSSTRISKSSDLRLPTFKAILSASSSSSILRLATPPLTLKPPSLLASLWASCSSSMSIADADAISPLTAPSFCTILSAISSSFKSILALTVCEESSRTPELALMSSAVCLAISCVSTESFTLAASISGSTICSATFAAI